MQLFILIILLLVCGIASIWLEKLTRTGAMTGILLALLIYAGSGWEGILLMACFFVLGSGATSWKHRQKERMGISKINSGRRNAGQVLANAGVPAVLGLLGWGYPGFHHLFSTMMAGAFSAATADTLSSELGSLYGSKFLNILNFKPDKRGRDGVISGEGTLFGIGGSILIATIHVGAFGWSKEFLWVVLAGTIGNFLDSVLGATLERRGRLTNDAVNVLNTLCGALVIWSLAGW
ncbi:MAG: DUF92 domain-containing protein [Flavisolibacter sp.]